MTMMPAFAVGILGVGLVLSGGFSLSAAAQGDCDWYAKTAVRQQQINEARKCGFTGQAWHKDLAAHVTWCAGVAPDIWKSEAQKRNQQLEACEKR